MLWGLHGRTMFQGPLRQRFTIIRSVKTHSLTKHSDVQMDLDLSSDNAKSRKILTLPHACSPLLRSYGAVHMWARQSPKKALPEGAFLAPYKLAQCTQRHTGRERQFEDLTTPKTHS